MSSNYSNQELQDLTARADDRWEFDASRKLIRRRPTPWYKRLLQRLLRPWHQLPVIAIYRLAKEKWLRETAFRDLNFPFESQTVVGVFKLDRGWSITTSDRRFLSEGPLYALDGHTLLVPSRKPWWLTGWGWTLRMILVPILIGLLPWFLQVALRIPSRLPPSLSDAPAPLKTKPDPAARQAIPDLARASVVHRALSLTDLNVGRAVLSEANPKGVRGYFNITTLQSNRLYTPVVVQISKDVSPNIFLTARVYGDTNINTLELQGLDVHFLIANHGNYYMIYNSEENQTSWKPLPILKNQGINTLGLYQVARRVWVFLNSQLVDSFDLWNTPSSGKVGLFFKANPRAQGHAHFQRLAVYQF